MVMLSRVGHPAESTFTDALTYEGVTLPELIDPKEYLEDNALKRHVDYLVKPFERSKLIATVRRGVEIQELRQENNTLRTRLFANELNSPGVFNDIVSVSDKMKAVFLYVEAVAPTRQPVLITGETGVGKELVAERGLLHALPLFERSSSRRLF